MKLSVCAIIFGTAAAESVPCSGTSLSCCDPFHIPTMNCPGNIACEGCGGSSACQCPGEVPLPSPSPSPSSSCRRRHCGGGSSPSPRPSPSPGNGKAGIAAHLNGDSDTDAIAGSRISWNYNWAMNGASKSGLDFFPQVHGAGFMGSIGELPDSDVLLGFNEPNMHKEGGGAAMGVGHVVELWPQVEQAASDHGVSILVGPGVANVNPVQWYDDFFNRCPNCRVDAIAFHSYNCDVQSMQTLVDSLRKYDKPLWLTEFACGDNPQAIAGNDGGSKDWNWQCEYMKQVLPYLEGEDIIAKYAWFSFDYEYTGKSKLVSGGQLTDLGNCYNNLASGLQGKGHIVAV